MWNPQDLAERIISGKVQPSGFALDRHDNSDHAGNYDGPAERLPILPGEPVVTVDLYYDERGNLRQR